MGNFQLRGQYHLSCSSSSQLNLYEMEMKHWNGNSCHSGEPAQLFQLYGEILVKKERLFKKKKKRHTFFTTNKTDVCVEY